MCIGQNSISLAQSRGYGTVLLAAEEGDRWRCNDKESGDEFPTRSQNWCFRGTSRLVLIKS